MYKLGYRQYRQKQISPACQLRPTSSEKIRTGYFQFSDGK